MLVLLRAPLAAPTTTLPSLEPNTLQPFGFPPATAVPHDECAVVLARPSETVLELFALGADRALHHRRRAAAGSECSCSWLMTRPSAAPEAQPLAQGRPLAHERERALSPLGSGEGPAWRCLPY